MQYFKCPQCQTIIPISDEAAGNVPTCKDCGSTLRLLKPVRKAPEKAGESSPAPSRPVSSENKRESGEERERPEREEPKPKLKSKKREAEKKDDEDGDEKPKRKKKKRGSSKSKPAGYDDALWPKEQYTGAEGENLLGPRKQVFKSGNSTIRMAAFLCGGLAAAGMLSCVLSLVTKMPDAAIPFTIVSIVAGLGGLLWCMNYLTLSVAVHPGGIVHSHRGKLYIIPWADISNITQSTKELKQIGGQTTDMLVYTLDLQDRTQLVYTSKLIQDLEKLGNILLKETSILLLPQVRVKYQSGEMFDFGRLGVNMEGLHYRKQLLGWQEIEGIKISDGYLTVSRQGKWVRWRDIEASSIPNLHVFLTFVDEILSAKDG